ncbi:MAG TPA: PUA domain-containing protein [Nitrososphaeraceae archaeon]
MNVLSKTETSKLINAIRSSWPSESIPKIKTLKVYDAGKNKYLLTAEKFVAVKVENTYVPFVGNIDLLQYFPFVTVDMRAVKFVCNGANIMRPGITTFQSFSKGSVVVIKDETHLKPLSAGIALQSSDEAAKMDKGCIINNIHYVGDSLWEIYKEIKE